MNRRMEEETERFLLEHYEEFYRLAYGYVKTEQDALDVVQESAYKAIRDCGKIQNPEYLKTWICRIVINTSVDLLRKKKKTLFRNSRKAVHLFLKSLLKIFPKDQKKIL